MMKLQAGNNHRPGRLGAILAMIAMLAGLVILAQPASAATDCVNDSGDLIVRINDEGGGINRLTMRGGELFVNGESCGTPVAAGGGQPNVTIVDIPTNAGHQVDEIEIDLAAGPWRAGGDAVFVNLVLRGSESGDPDRVTIQGTSIRDIVEPRGDFLIVYREAFYPGTSDNRQLFLFTQSSQSSVGGRTVYNAEYRVNMKGGRDLFNMRPDPFTSGWFGAKIVAKGGSGNDTMFGGPGRDRMRGGKGDDRIEGKSGSDILKGNAGNDEILGGTGNDKINGGNGRDLLKGNRGNDRIIGGGDRDRARGGPGADFFRMDDGIRDFKTRGGKGADTCRCDPNDPLGSTRRL